MRILKIIKAMEGDNLTLCTPVELVRAIELADFILQLNTGHLETLENLHKDGPIWDGDLITKAYRSDLLRCGAVVGVSVKGEEGFNACTYLGLSVLKGFRAALQYPSPDVQG